MNVRTAQQEHGTGLRAGERLGTYEYAYTLTL
ncbi:hypothetical protein SAMN06265218_11942 [Fodinibius sediminis]|uniref:Uncharacterized protein n=1 Tax=Fodinibius sediminis TaxID=1214077 RepID=A0A521EVM3_9BACT|nr:hypothetical protein SAMN06265218_11942 [Fodinibius sediminis]